MHRLRLIAGPLLIAVAAWCAAGRLTVAEFDRATPRIAVPAPWWVLIVAGLLAAAVPGWRRDWRLALPALLATIPWWPVPLPVVALLWTGPLAWVPLALALALAVGGAPWRHLVAIDRLSARVASGMAGALTLALGLAAAWAAAPRVPTDDEPHYLLITQSLLEDHDLRVENNRLRHDYSAYYPGDIPKSHYIVRGKNEEIYSIHAPGLPVIVLPAFAVFGYRGAEAMVLGLAALAGALVWWIGWVVTADRSAAWFAWAAIVGSVTFLVQSFTIFPDGPAALIVAASTLLLVRLADPDEANRPGRVGLVGVSALLAALPWLHTRFSVLAAGFGAAILGHLLTDRLRPMRTRIRAAAAFALVPTVSLLGWLAYFYVIYGTTNPAAPYGNTSGPGGTHLRNAPGALLGVLFDGQFGLIVYAPVLAYAAVGWWRAPDPRSRRVGLETGAAIGLYAVAAMTYWMWWAGLPAPPARFLAATLPALAVPIAAAWSRGDAARRSLMLTLLAASAAITALVFSVDRAGLVWNDRDAQAQWLAWLGPVVNLRRAWPSFFWKLDINGADADHLSSEWPFVWHVAAWLVTFVGTWATVRTVAGWLRPGPVRWRAAAAVWLVTSLTLAATVGWGLTGSSGLDAGRSQAAVLASLRRGARALTLDAFALHSLRAVAGQVVMAGEEPGRLADPPPDWFTLSGLPAGVYELRVELERPLRGHLDVRAGEARTTVSLPGVSAVSVPLRLEAPGSVTVAPDADLRGTTARVLLIGRGGE